VCNHEQATEQQWRDHDTEWKPGDRDCGDREDTEPATPASVTPLVVEEMNSFEPFYAERGAPRTLEIGSLRSSSAAGDRRSR
jgi:hypothetical protein